MTTYLCFKLNEETNFMHSFLTIYCSFDSCHQQQKIVVAKPIMSFPSVYILSKPSWQRTFNIVQFHTPKSLDCANTNLCCNFSRLPFGSILWIKSICCSVAVVTPRNYNKLTNKSFLRNNLLFVHCDILHWSCTYQQPAFLSLLGIVPLSGMGQLGSAWGSGATCDSVIPAAPFACQHTSPGCIWQYQSVKCFDTLSYTVCSTTITGCAGRATSITLRKRPIPDSGPPDGAFGVPLYARTATPNLHSNIHCVGNV
jgi:hypothetical protein